MKNIDFSHTAITSDTNKTMYRLLDLLIRFSCGKSTSEEIQELETPLKQNINVKFGMNNMTLLHYAVSLEKRTMVKYLLQRHANISIQDDAGRLPIHYTTNLAIIKYLVKHNSEINKADKMGRTPLYKAVLYQVYDTIQYLLEQKANIDIKTSDNRTIFDLYPNDTKLQLILQSTKNHRKKLDIILEGNELDYADVLPYSAEHSSSLIENPMIHDSEDTRPYNAVIPEDDYSEDTRCADTMLELWRRGDPTAVESSYKPYRIRV